MALISTVLFDTPQSEIASLINRKMSAAAKIKIITGFVTVEGIRALEIGLKSNPSALEVLVTGAGTYKAYEAFDRLIELGVLQRNLFVHLGHTRMTKDNATHPFYRYHPMLHSKIYYIENPDNTACAFVGSHNMTGFAMKGLNGEASIMLDGPKNDQEFEKIRKHIELAKNEAISYDNAMKEAFSWWTYQFMQGLAQKTNDNPKEIDKKKTILVFCECQKPRPKRNDIFYFELPEALGKVQSLQAEVHVFVFDALPPNPEECIANLHQTKESYWCKIEGIEYNEGGKELSADWYIEDQFKPVLKKAPNPFRPTPKLHMQQVRVRLLNAVYGTFDYLFGKQNNEWLPILNQSKSIVYDQEFSLEIQKLALVPPESNQWFLVSGLEPEEEKLSIKNDSYQLALKSMEPESGTFILFSTARKKSTQ